MTVLVYLLAIAMQTSASGIPKEMMCSGLTPEYMDFEQSNASIQMQNPYDPQPSGDAKSNQRPMLIATRILTGIGMVGFPIAAFAVESAYQKEFRDYKEKNRGSSAGYPTERRESFRMIETIFVCTGIANAAIFMISFAI